LDGQRERPRYYFAGLPPAPRLALDAGEGMMLMSWWDFLTLLFGPSHWRRILPEGPSLDQCCEAPADGA